MNSAAIGAVLYANDHAQLAAFYRQALGLVPLESDSEHTRLRCGGFDLVVHQVAGHRAVSTTVAPPQRREHGAIRLIFSVPDVNASRAAALSLGGQVDEQPPRWAAVDSPLRLGHDPEGNVFQVQPQAR